MWSERTVINVADDGRVPIGTQRLRVEAAPKTQLVLREQPNPIAKPQILFTNLPKPPVSLC